MVSAAIIGALKTVENEYGVKITEGGGNFSEDNYTCKMNISCIGEDGVVKTHEAESFKSSAEVYGLDPTDLNKVVTISGLQIRIKGIKPRNHKMPIIGEDIVTGKLYKFPVRSIQIALGRKPTDIISTLIGY
jgi:hypothetical protein